VTGRLPGHDLAATMWLSQRRRGTYRGTPRHAERSHPRGSTGPPR